MRPEGDLAGSEGTGLLDLDRLSACDFGVLCHENEVLSNSNSWTSQRLWVDLTDRNPATLNTYLWHLHPHPDVLEAEFAS